MAKQVYTTGQILTAAQMTTLQANDYNQTVSAKVASYTLVAADAGTRITMSNASATTITVNTSIFTAGDTLEITNIGAGVLTVTAGTATVSTSSTLALKQFDSGQLYFTSAGVAIFFASDAADSPLTTKGDLFTFSTTNDRLAVGSDGDTIVADSSTTTGLRYQTGVNNNSVINGGMDIWQRGTSFAIPSSAYTYTADRWIGLRFSTGSTVSQQTASLDGFQFSARVARDSGNIGTGIIYLGYNLETADSYKYAGKTVTLSFYAKAGANFSAASSALAVVWTSGTGTNQKQMDGFTGAATLASSTVTLTTSWQRFSFTAAVPSNSTQQGFQFNYTPVGTAGAADYFEVVGVQQEFGSVPTNFKRAGGGTMQGELAACRYYYRRNVATGNAFGAVIGQTQSSTTTAAITSWNEGPMRAIPTSVDFANIALADGITTYAISNVTIGAGATLVTPSLNITSTGMTAFRPFYVCGNNNAAGFLGISAEL